jgi:hypothetical protein
VGKRRDDITNEARVQIVLGVLAPDRKRGEVTRLAEDYGISRQTVYEMARKGEAALLAGLTPGSHGPVPQPHAVTVDRNRLQRSTVVLTEAGVSQRDIEVCVMEMLDTRVSPAWVNGVLAGVEQRAAQVNADWQPEINEILSGDEIYANGMPNLLVVGNTSLYIYALSRQAACDGETWACVLWDSPVTPQFASDGGLGLAAGARLAGKGTHQLDWDHLLRPLWGQASRLERQAYAVLEALETRAAQFNHAHTPKRLAHHLQAWEKLATEADVALARYDAFVGIARQVDTQFALIDLVTGSVHNQQDASATLRDLGQQLHSWSGRIYQKLSSNLLQWAEALFAYVPLLDAALQPLRDQWGGIAIRALSRMWQVEANTKRHPLSLPERQAQQQIWEASLDEAVTQLGDEHLWTLWETLSQVLDRSWRGSMLAECVNSLLRPQLNARKHTDQGCLELFRFLHNVRPFKRGKRAHHSPAQLVGLSVPDDPLLLLGLAPKVSI